MRRRMSLLVVLVLFTLSFTSTPHTNAYSSQIEVGDAFFWVIEAAPSTAFNMFYTGGGDWLAQYESAITFSISFIEDDVLGDFHIGNVSVTANDTDIAKDLTLGVWGTPTEWWPGLIVKVGAGDIESLNQTAYAAAERVAGNYLNGTMTSTYQSIIGVNEQSHDCVVFDYEQDPSGFGEPQRTHLAYALDTGILIEANTSYSFGTPYNLAFRYYGPLSPTVVDFSVDPGPIITIMGIGAGILVAIVVLAFWKLGSRN